MLLPVAVIRLHDGDLHAVGWGEGPWALVTPVKAIRVEVGLCKNPPKWTISVLGEPKLSRLFCHFVEEIETKLSCLVTSTGRSRQVLRFGLVNSGLLVHLIDCLRNWTKIQNFYREDALIRQTTGDGISAKLFCFWIFFTTPAKPARVFWDYICVSTSVRHYDKCCHHG